MQELRNLTAHKEISYIRIKEDDSLLKCEAFSTRGYVGNCVLRNKAVIKKVKDYASMNKIKGTEIEAILRNVARLHLKIKSGWIDDA